MRALQFLPLALWLLAGTPAQAQVYKCSRDGAVHFTDRPCESGSQPLQAAAAAADGSLDFEIMTRHYAVSGQSLEAARLAMRRASPDGFAGWARWKVNYQFATRPAGRDCVIHQVRIKVVGDILMPQWTDALQAPSRDQDGWRQMYDALKRHEDGHVQHGREFGLLLKERLLGIGAAPCAELASRVQQEYTALYANLNHRDREYDRRTNHGLRQDNPQ